ncbi:MAG: hypothetical protein WCZ89_00195 [Phycisphaerae bacterium]
MGLPLQWLGKALCEREVRILKKVRDIENVQNFVCRYGDYGFVYQYINGKPLSKVKETPEDFFDKLEELLQNLHRRNICYVDMNKRDNIIVGKDGQPNLIDFQISVQIGKYSLGLPAFSKMIQNKLEKADRYHVLKHKRRLKPMSLKPSEWQASYSPSGLIKIHRVIATPIRRLRRKVLKSLHKKQPLIKQ